MHLPSLHFARESQSMSFLHPCKGAVKALIILKTIWHWHYTVVSYWGIPWHYMILNNTCNPLRFLSKFYLTFFLFDTAVTLIMHCNKHIKSDDGLFESLGYPQLARRLRSRKPQQQCNLRSDVVILYFSFFPLFPKETDRSEESLRS